VEKQMTLSSPRNYGLKTVVISRPAFSTAPAANLRMVSYRHPQLKLNRGAGPTCTFFGRTKKGGFFTGVELAFDNSSLSGNQLVLGYHPSIKVAAGERVPCEPVYFGVYRRRSDEPEPQSDKFPMRCESDAMVAMTSMVLNPPRFAPISMASPWQCETSHAPARTQQTLAEDMKLTDFLAECGLNYTGHSVPWGGDAEKLAALVGDQHYVMGELNRKFLEHAQKRGLKVQTWPTWNNTNNWGGGRPFRPDKPEWQLKLINEVNKRNTNANCIANAPFLKWLTALLLEQLSWGYTGSFGTDGDFFGGGGFAGGVRGEPWVHPARCDSNLHDHLPGDSNYAAQRSLRQLFAAVREHYPDIVTYAARPHMDMGVWTLRNVAICFTVHEWGAPGNSNLLQGDGIRTWSRMRVHHHFFPHYVDFVNLFPPRTRGPKAPANWPQGHIDYIMLSALSSTPHQMYFLPALSGIPQADKAEIRKWLDWGRKNAAYLNVRQDLLDWPAPGKVDGSAHILGDQGLVFLFNSDKEPLEGRFDLTEEAIGLKAKGTLQVSQEYPPSDRKINATSGQTVRWQVPGETAVILQVQPVAP